MAIKDPDKNGSLLYRIWLKSKNNGTDETEAENPVTENAGTENPDAENSETTLPCEPPEPPEDSLRKVWEQWQSASHCEPEESFNPLEFASEEIPANELKCFTEELEQLADAALDLPVDLPAEAEPTAQAEPTEQAEPDAQAESTDEEITESTEAAADVSEEPILPPEEIPPPPIDASAHLCIAADGSIAWGFVFPPRNGGAEITEEKLRAALQEKKIVAGVNEEIIGKIVAGTCYFKVVIIAKGTPATDGQDGKITNSLLEKLPAPTEEQIRTEGGVSNSLCKVSKGDVIFRIAAPVEPVEGINVKGEKLRGYMGKPVNYPRIPNTGLSEDGTAVISMIDGHLTRINHKYMVQSLLIIGGDVDIAVGDLDFKGDIQIKGDVRDGFTVKAKGDIQIYGMVENATIIAGGDIVISKGMNGNSQGSLEAKGNITSKFLENCTATACGCIYSESIICSEVSSNDSIITKGGKGVIIGGTCVALNKIQASCVGTKAQRITTLVLGNTNQLIQKCKEVESSLKEIRTQLESVRKDISYLESCGKELSEERKGVLNARKIRKTVLAMQEQKATAEFALLQTEMASSRGGRIQCNMIYPTTKIVIGKEFMTISEVQSSCNFYLDEDGFIKTGML